MEFASVIDSRLEDNVSKMTFPLDYETTLHFDKTPHGSVHLETRGFTAGHRFFVNFVPGQFDILTTA